MTPKEKAEELYQKMSYWQMVDGGTRQIEAKQCALIAVYEILKALEIEFVDDEPYSASKIIDVFEYFEQVKNETEKL